MVQKLGEYPPEYNRTIHGPYDPARYYGKADTPLAEVKIGDLKSWLGRRNFSPRAMASACSRAYWRWSHKYMLPKKAGIAPAVHMVLGSIFFFYMINIGKIREHRLVKYHW